MSVNASERSPAPAVPSLTGPQMVQAAAIRIRDAPSLEVITESVFGFGPVPRAVPGF